MTELVLFAQKPVPTSEEAVTSKTKKVIARPSDLKFDFTLSSYELCSKALYRSVFISDVPFNPKTLPKEMKLILNKNEEFEHRYVYRLLTNQSFIIPTQTVTEEDPTGGLIRGRNLAASEQLEQQKRQESKFMSALKPSNADDLDGEIPQSFVPMATPNIQQDNRSPNPRLGSSQPFRNSEVDKRQTDLEDDMQGKVLFKTQNDVKIGQKLFELEPTPIMSLYNRQGVDTVNGEIAFSTDSTGVVISNKNLICTNIVNNYQRFLIGHDRTVACFSVVHNDNLLISADTGDPCEVIIWRIVPARIVCRFKIDMKLVHAVDVCKFTRDDSTLIHAVFVGIDAMDRDLIMVYDVTEYSMNNCKLFTKQISDFHIKRLRYLDHSNPNILVSCGKDNICFWQVKNKFLTIQPVNLNEHSYNNFFHAIDVLKQKMIVEKKPSGAHGEKAFNSGDQVADAKGSRNCYFVYVVSSLGFMYLIDYNLGEMKTVLRLHSAAINCIKISHNHNFIVTGGADNFVRIWSIDSSELLFDFKLDSQVSGLAINNEDLILLSTLSGSVGTIDIQNKMFKGMVRSHSDKIIDMDYNKTKRILMTLSLDRTLRLWDCKNKTSQIYEFQCLDEQPLCLCSYSLNHYVLVGFRGGLVRLFDIHNYIFVKEFTEAQADIVKIRVSADDQFFVTADASGTLIIYDGQGEYRRTILVEYEPDNFILDLDYYCQSLLCTKSPFSLLLFSTNSWEIKQKISLNEEIETARFSYLKDRVIVLTKKGKLKFYLASYHEIVFLKDFGCLHDGGVKDFESSLNCAYILTIGKVDNTIKVWDYNFRGNLVPAYQSFSLNENSTLLKLSNDDQGLVFTANDCNINTWMFKGSFEDMKLKAHSEEIEKREKQLLQLEESATSGVLNRRAIASSIDPLDMGVKPKGLYNQEGHIVGELAQGQSEAERMLKEMEDIQNKVKNGSLGSPDPSGRGQPGSKSVRFKDNLVEVDEEKLKRDKDFIELEYLASKMAGRDNKPETSSEIDRASAARTNQTKLTSGSAEPNPKQDYEKFTHECLKTAHVLGTNPMVRHSVKWDTENEYYSLICSNKVLINYFDEEESQKSLDSVFIGNASILAISSKSKYLVVGVDASNSEPSAGFSVYDCRTLFRMHSSRLNSAEKILICEISKKEDYLMLVYKPFDTEYSYVQVWDILNNKAILESAINEPLLTGLWNPFGIHYSEFVTISKDKVFFWRMSRNNTLQYQAITVNDLGGKIDKDYTAVTYFELSDQFKTCLVIVGTSHGGILLIDSRSAVVVAYINSLINESIQLIEANDGVINISGTTPNIYSYFANENTRRSITDFVKIFESSPQIMSLDGKIGSLHFPAHFKGMEGLATTSAGSLWYLNWKDRLTLRLKSWHCHQRKVLAFDYNADKKKCFTSAADFTVKIWNDNSCEEEVELFVPNKGCLCMASRKDTLICGFTDGTVR